MAYMSVHYEVVVFGIGFVDKVFVVVVKTIISLLEKVIHVVSCD